MYFYLSFRIVLLCPNLTPSILTTWPPTGSSACIKRDWEIYIEILILFVCQSVHGSISIFTLIYFWRLNRKCLRLLECMYWVQVSLKYLFCDRSLTFNVSFGKICNQFGSWLNEELTSMINKDLHEDSNAQLLAQY